MGLDLQELQDIIKNTITQNPHGVLTKLIDFHRDGGSISVAQNQSGFGTLIPYKNWRVVAAGFVVTVGGVSGENPELEFGIGLGDEGAEDNDYFGSVFQSPVAGEEFVAGDVWIRDTEGYLITPEVPAGGGGGISWAAGAGKMGVWLNKATYLSVRRLNDHVLTVIPFMLVEVRI